MDKIMIKNLEVFAHHGVFPEETALRQKFYVNCTMYVDTRKAGCTDDLTASVHYGEVAHFITRQMQENTYKLIESVAENLAHDILIVYPLVQKITIEISKPNAPVGLPLDTVAVEVTRGWHTAYIALGSNMGDSEAYLNEAVDSLDSHKDCQVVKVSDYYETEPYGGVEQDKFLNGVLELKTLLEPQELLETLNKIEADNGRERLIHWGPRTLDLDILLYDDDIIDTETLHVPHIDMQHRDFVLEPLAEIAPFKRHPYLNKTVQQLWDELQNQ